MSERAGGSVLDDTGIREENERREEGSGGCFGNMKLLYIPFCFRETLRNIL